MITASERLIFEICWFSSQTL